MTVSLAFTPRFLHQCGLVRRHLVDFAIKAMHKIDILCHNNNVQQLKGWYVDQKAEAKVNDDCMMEALYP